MSLGAVARCVVLSKRITPSQRYGAAGDPLSDPHLPSASVSRNGREVGEANPWFGVAARPKTLSNSFSSGRR
jgi:hypothetical protein